MGVGVRKEPTINHTHAQPCTPGKVWCALALMAALLARQVARAAGGEGREGRVGEGKGRPHSALQELQQAEEGAQHRPRPVLTDVKAWHWGAWPGAGHLGGSLLARTRRRQALLEGRKRGWPWGPAGRAAKAGGEGLPGLNPWGASAPLNPSSPLKPLNPSKLWVGALSSPPRGGERPGFPQLQPPSLPPIEWSGGGTDRQTH